MERVAFCLRLREGAGDAYDQVHREVWPEILALLKAAGVSEYSIFRRDELVVLSMHVEDFDRTWDRIEQSPVNTRWQRAMMKFFMPIDTLRSGERFPMMHEIFYMK